MTVAIEKPFYLVAIREGHFIDLPGEEFENGDRADERAAALALEMGCKVQPRRRVSKREKITWRERQQARLDDGTYKKLPQEWDLEPIPDHFAHISKKDDKKIAFTESAEKGEVDKTTVLSVGRYLERFYPTMPMAVRNRYIAMIDLPPPLKLAVTADEIEDVYCRGPNSCMSLGADCFGGHCHPVRIYGDSDLSLAYIENDEKRVMARMLVLREKKIFKMSLGYGDRERLKLALLVAGFTETNDFKPFYGAKVHIIEDEKDKSRIIAPSFDFGPWQVSECGKYLLFDLTSGIWGATAGWIHKPEALVAIERNARSNGS